MRYILICETPFPSRKVPGRALHVKAMARDEVIKTIRWQWSGIEQTLSILDGASDQAGAAGRHFGVPIDTMFGRFMLHVDGKMDFETRRYKLPCPRCNAEGKPCVHRLPLEWVDSDHQCGPSCMLRPYQRVSQAVFGGRR
jgi:hypothetical protein